MATKYIEPCGDATQDTSFLLTIQGTVTADTAVFNRTNGGTGAAYKFDRTTANLQASAHTQSAILADAGRRASFWFQFTQLAQTADDVFRIRSGAATVQSVTFGTSGKFTFANGGSTGATVLTPNTWYRITISYTITSTTVNSFKLYINGVQELTNTNLTLPGTGSDHFQFLTGTGGAFGANFAMWIDDLYVDDGTDLGDPGDIRSTAKLPASNNVNNYNTAVGANPANRWTNVNERPLSITNGWEDTQVGGGIIENYGIQGVSQGDVDISTYNQIAYMGWMWAAEGSVSGSPKLTVNGVDNAVTLTTSPALYTAITDSSNYPANAATIGQKSGTSASGTFLYECGVIVAYKWALPGSTAISMFTPTMGAMA